MPKGHEWEIAGEAAWGVALLREAVIRPLAEHSRLSAESVAEAADQLGVDFSACSLFPIPGNVAGIPRSAASCRVFDRFIPGSADPPPMLKEPSPYLLVCTYGTAHSLPFPPHPLPANISSLNPSPSRSSHDCTHRLVVCHRPVGPTLFAHQSG